MIRVEGGAVEGGTHWVGECDGVGPPVMVGGVEEGGDQEEANSGKVGNIRWVMDGSSGSMSSSYSIHQLLRELI